MYYNSKETLARKTPNNVSYSLPFIKRNKIHNLLCIIFNNQFLKTELKEIFHFVKNNSFNLAFYKQYLIAVRTLRYFSNSKPFKKILKSNSDDIVYFYWGTSAILTIPLLKRQTFVRIHGGEFNTYYTGGYVPFLKSKANVDTTFLPISLDSQKKILSINPNAFCELNFLGTFFNFNYKEKSHTPPIHVVSCSSIIPLKRIDLIIEALKLCENDLKWTHFGDGELFINMLEKCQKELPKNIFWDIKGRISNSEILDFYQNTDIQLFINVSETEGIPVSIMEAMSFGIPCFATNVGGTSEIVNESNGFIVDVDFSIKELSTTIDSILSLDYKTRSMNSRLTWERKFDAMNNYKKLTEIFSLKNT